jgi:hypothetical protein
MIYLPLTWVRLSVRLDLYMRIRDATTACPRQGYWRSSAPILSLAASIAFSTFLSSVGAGPCKTRLVLNAAPSMFGTILASQELAAGGLEGLEIYFYFRA